MGAPACIAGPATMVICDLLSINLNHTFYPLNTTISDYAIDPFGWLEKPAFNAQTRHSSEDSIRALGTRNNCIYIRYL